MVYTKEGNGVGFLLLSPKGEMIPLSYNLEFDSMNNITEYEALTLGLQVSPNMKIDCLSKIGDSWLAVKYIRGSMPNKTPNA